MHGTQSPLAPEPLGSGVYSSKRAPKRALCAQSETALLPLEGKLESLALGIISPAPGSHPPLNGSDSPRGTSNWPPTLDPTCLLSAAA